MVFERYLFKNLLIATVFISVTLAAIILLTQSLRFLELVINSGASASAFWMLTLLALPRFFEIILPIALMTATVFIYNKMAMDSELTAMRAAGASPAILARPALALAGTMVVLLWFMTTWLGPVSLSNMHHMRQTIKAQYSTLLFREGVFNAVRPGLMVFVRERGASGELNGLIIHDSRDKTKQPVTILAKRGAVASTEDGQQVIVYEGSRQDIDMETGALNRLDFKRYSIDLPGESGPIRQRWREPDERTLFELLRPNSEDERDLESKRAFFVEIHRRIVTPILAPAFTVIALAFLLVGPADRRGQGMRIMLAACVTVIIQGLYLAAFSLANASNWGLLLMYILAFAPLGAGLFMLGRGSEQFRRKILYRSARKAAS